MTEEEKFRKAVIEYMENNNKTINEILKTIQIQNIAIKTLATFQPEKKPKTLWSRLFDY